MNQATAHSTNFFLDGNFSLVTDERDAQDMTVKGSIPKDLTGHFLRVGPNPVHLFSEDAHHSFDGDGMIHAIEFSDGKAHYRNRFVHDEAENQSECLILDAQDIETGPVATIMMPFRVPYGFHAGWVSAA